VVPYAKSIVVSNFDSYVGDDVAVVAWMSEIIVFNGANGGISWRFSNPTVYPIPFSPHSELSSYWEHAPLLVGDVNGDGTKEIILLNWAKVYAVSRRRISYFFYKTVIPWATCDFSSGITAYAMGNFDGDAYPDIAVGTLDGKIYTLFDLVEAVKYQLQISTTAGGTTSPTPGKYTYSENAQVTITALPESGYQFDHWLINGTTTGTENPITIMMDANYAITAYFTTVQTHTLTIETTTGGTTSPSPGTYTHAHGEEVSIIAVPDSGYIFDRWILSNDTTSTRNPIVLIIDTDYTITAYFRNATGVIPHDNLYINEDTILAPGFYNLEDDYDPEGIIIINASNIVLDCNYAVLNGSGWGVAIVNHGFDNVTIKNAIIQNFEWSIYIEYGENNVITYNELVGASMSSAWANNTQIMYNHLLTSYIDLWMSHLSTVMNNTLEDCDITVERSNNCAVMYNNISLGGITVSGSSYYSANYNLVTRNNITGGPGRGIELFTADHNIIAENYVANKTQSGIYLTDSDFNIIVGNIVNLNGESGIRIRSIWWSSGGYWVYGPSFNNTIAANTASFNVEGIYLNGETKYSTIVNNTLTQNDYGIFLQEMGGYCPTYNTIYHNNFINNTVLQAYDDGANAFNTGYPSGGNYWSNYTGTDANHDGIGDTPYIIDTNSQDNYPIINSNSWEPYNILKSERKLKTPSALKEPLLPPHPLITVTLLLSANLALAKFKKRNKIRLQSR
jgi:parallel beta-helix repeat protein